MREDRTNIAHLTSFSLKTAAAFAAHLANNRQGFSLCLGAAGFVCENERMKVMKTIAAQKKYASQNVRMLTMSAVLSAISFILAFLEFPVPLSPSFARMDLSDLPALIGALTYGPVAGIFIERIKNALQLLTSSTGGIGELANFIMGSSFAAAAGALYQFHKTKRNAVIACLFASLVMGITAAVVNYYILLPVFETFMLLDQLIASFGRFIPFIQTKRDVVLYNALPFNV